MLHLKYTRVHYSFETPAAFLGKPFRKNDFVLVSKVKQALTIVVAVEQELLQLLRGHSPKSR